jgi:tetratricopeptide (TPR) repeat protein
MKKLLALTLFLAALSFADEAGLQFERANELYRNGDFRNAAAVYEQIVSNGLESPVLYFNLGNAYFKQSNIPLAILNYERARRLAPRDEDILYNLRLANLRVVDKIEPIPQLFFVEWWEWGVGQYSSDGWSVATVSCFWITALALCALFLLRSDLLRRILLLTACASLLLGIFSLTASIKRASIETGSGSAIVFSQSVPAKSAPDLQGTDLFVLHEGVKVEILDEVGEWKKIRLADGKVGWIQTGSIREI